MTDQELKILVDKYKDSGDTDMTFEEYIKMLWALIDYYDTRH